MSQMVITLLICSSAFTRWKSVGTDKKAPDIIEQSLCKNIEEQVKKSVPLFRNVQDILLLGRGFSYAVANETELKIMEASYTNAKAYSSCDYPHGPIATTKRFIPVIFFLTDEKTNDSTIKLIEKIKKDFSGYILDPLQIFKSKGGTPYISEKSIIRPTFSYLGKFTISDSVFRQIAERVAKKMPEIYDVSRIRTQNYGDGISIYLEVIINYGNNIIEVLQNYKARVKKEIEKQTAMNIIKIDLVAKGIHMNEE